MAMDVCPSSCGLYRPGHEVHWIQARLAQREGTWRRAGVVSVEQSRAVVPNATGHLATVHHHHPLEQYVEPGVQVLVTERFGVLNRGTTLLCVQVTDGLGSELTPGELPYEWPAVAFSFGAGDGAVSLRYPPQEA